MIKVYEASNGAEAHLILDLLNHAGLYARIDGEYLQGGIGDIQAFGLVRVMVEETEFTQARILIDQWENNETVDIEDEQQNMINNEVGIQSANSFDGMMNLLIVGLLGIGFGIFFTFLYFTTPLTKNGIDYDGDGIPEEWYIYKGDRISQVKQDRNMDDIVDVQIFYDYKGLLKSSISDDDFNGTFESESKFRNGNTVWTKMDTNGDGYKNYHMHFLNGVLNSIVFYDSTTKKKVKINHYKSLVLTNSEVDTDHDGVIDSRIEYDEYENPIKTISIK